VIPGEIAVFPAIIISAQHGNIESKSVGEIVTVNIIIGCFDDTLNQQGYRDCCNLLQRLKDRFGEIDFIRETFAIRYPISWQLNKKIGNTAVNNSYPYFFGEMQINFELPTMDTQFDVTKFDGDIMLGRYNEFPIPTVSSGNVHTVQQAPINPGNTYG
jgi:hypothetical protein